MTSYFRYPFFAGGAEPLEIIEQEYENAKKAAACVFPALFIEEQFDAILKTYIEFETTVYAIGLRSMVHAHGGWRETVEDNLLINSRVIANLTSCRMYIDHVPQRLHAVFGKPHGAIDEFHAARREEHEKYLGYRFCYALRNFSEHSDLPVHGLVIDSDWVEQQIKCEHRVAVQTSLAELTESDFNKTVLAELKETYKGGVDIVPLIRQNVTSFGRIHEVIRKRLDPEMDKWEQWIADVVDKSKQGSHPELAKVSDEDEILEKVRVSKDWPERLRMLLHKNRNVTHYDKHYVTGEPFKARAK